MIDVDRLFSKDPAVQRKLANETLEYLKLKLAQFDASRVSHRERLMAYATEARDEGTIRFTYQTQ